MECPPPPPGPPVNREGSRRKLGGGGVGGGIWSAGTGDRRDERSLPPPLFRNRIRSRGAF